VKNHKLDDFDLEDLVLILKNEDVENVIEMESKK
jgi:hypothetical protein